MRAQNLQEIFYLLQFLPKNVKIKQIKTAAYLFGKAVNPLPDRVILHCDCNSFFASVEEKLCPELKKVPMAVAGDPENRHGIILAKNQLAKKYDIRTAEPIWQALGKCPELVCVPPHHGLYGEFCKKINEIYIEYTDLVEPASIDESYLDVTNSIHLFGLTPVGLADELRRRIREEIGVTISVGVSFCKTFAKFGSDYKKPDATTLLSRDTYRDIMYPLPVSELLMAGKKTVDKLDSLGIKTIGQLAAADRELLAKYLGKAGVALWENANGLDTEPVRSFYEKREVKSVGNSMTFRRDLLGEEEIKNGIAALADSVAGRLKAEKKKCTVVQIGIRDPQFNTLQRQKTLASPTDLQKTITESAMELVRANWNFYKPVRLLSVTAAGLVEENEAYTQLGLFDVPAVDSEKQGSIESAMTDIRKKFGASSIRFGYFSDDETGVK